MKKYLVTGGAGFIGSHLVDALVSQGNVVHVVDTLKTGDRENLNKKAHLHIGDIRDAAALNSLLKETDTVFHLAADSRVHVAQEELRETHDVNLTGTLNMLNACVQNGVEKLIFSSSAAVYGDNGPAEVAENMPASPQNAYGIQKLASEEYCRLFAREGKIKTCVLRFFNVYGPRMPLTGQYAGVVRLFLEQKRTGKPLTIRGDGSQTRDFIHVNDVVAALIAADSCAKANAGTPINVGTGTATSVRELANLFDAKTVCVPALRELKNSCADISRARALLNWEPRISLASGIHSLLNT